MKALAGNTCKVLAGLVAIGVFVVGFLAYFVFSLDPSTHQQVDGLGRALEPSPWFIRLIFGQERLWPGWGWWLTDFVWFWGGLGIAYGLFQLGERTNMSGPATDGDHER